jgi:exodeoxyribonuclease V alpha subunit
VSHFAAATLEVLDAQPERLTEVPGLGRRRAEAIAAAWRAQHAARMLTFRLQQAGVNPAHAARILALYGAQACEILQSDPYRLAEDWPVAGFPVAEALARSAGMPAEEPRRVQACLLHLLEQAAEAGHSFLPLPRLLQHAATRFALPEDLTREHLAALEAAGGIVQSAAPQGESAVYLAALFAAETGIAQRLAAMLAVAAPGGAPPREALPERIARQLALCPSPAQVEILQRLPSLRVAVITGAAGTGKTTLVRSAAALLEEAGRTVLLAAPTGRAARRLSEAAGRSAATIHRLLGFNPAEGVCGKNRDNPLEADVVIVDEASMVDTPLMHQLLDATPLSAALILVGDTFQLPPVGPGAVLSDLIASDRLPVFRLQEIFRQGQGSAIVESAHQVRRGEMPRLESTWPPEGHGQFLFLPETDPAAAADRIAALCAEALPAALGIDPLRDIQVLTPMHRGPAGTLQLNQLLQRRLNPGRADGSFRPGDKVMQLRNNYPKEVFNGDIGVVSGLDAEGGGLQVAFDERCVPYAAAERDELTLAYAITVHKAQGSEYPVVVLALMPEHRLMLQRNLLYTALTRGRRLVVLVGSREALAAAVANDRPRLRRSGLAARLKAAD